MRPAAQVQAIRGLACGNAAANAVHVAAMTHGARRSTRRSSLFSTAAASCVPNTSEIDDLATGADPRCDNVLDTSRVMKRLTSVALIFASACAFPTPHASEALVAAKPRVHIDEKAERAWIGVNGRARVIELGGNEHLGTTLTIHGINAAPNDVALLSNAALARGERTLTIAYDDNYRRLQDTADDFARQVEAVQSMLPPQTRLRIDAHSMGARAIVVALDRMQRAGHLTRSHIDLHLIAPLLRGVRAANQAWMMPLLLPFGLSTLVKNAEPARDLAESSEFQRELEAARFPANIRVAITLAEHDRFASKDATCTKLAQRWRASVLVLPGTTHLSIVSAASSQDHLPALITRAPAEQGRTARHADRRSVHQSFNTLAATSGKPWMRDQALLAGSVELPNLGRRHHPDLPGPTLNALDHEVQLPRAHTR